MHGKMSMLLAGLMLMVVTTLPLPNTVEAQGVGAQTGNIRGPLVVGVGEKETAEIYLGTRGTHGKTQGPEIRPGDTITWTYQVSNTGDATCTQTIKALLEPTNFGLPMFSLSKSDGFLFINGEEVVERLEDCFGDDRVVIQVGGDRRSKFSDNNSPIPTTVPVPYRVMGYSIVGPNGETRASWQLSHNGNIVSPGG